MVSVPDSILPDLRLGDQPVAKQGDLRTKDARLRVDDVIGEGRRQHDVEQADETTVGNVAGEQRRAAEREAESFDSGTLRRALRVEAQPGRCVDLRGAEGHTSELQALMRI